MDNQHKSVLDFFSRVTQVVHVFYSVCEIDQEFSGNSWEVSAHLVATFYDNLANRGARNISGLREVGVPGQSS